jgi:hypothetical protein
MKNAKRLGGKKAQEAGKGFEDIFCTLSRYQGFHVERMPDGCKQVNAKKFVRVKTPFDYMLLKEFRFYAFIDCKTVDSDRFKYSAIVDHQLESLTLIGRHAIAGYIVWFRKGDTVSFFDWQVLSRLAPNHSLFPSDGIVLGPIQDFRLSRLESHHRMMVNANFSTNNYAECNSPLF